MQSEMDLEDLKGCPAYFSTALLILTKMAPSLEARAPAPYKVANGQELQDIPGLGRHMPLT